MLGLGFLILTFARDEQRSEHGGVSTAIIRSFWCTNTIIGEVAVEATQMKIHSDVPVQMTLGHGIKVPQITYLTAPCRRARQDDQNGHLDDPIRSPDGKVTSPGRSPTRPCQAGRPDIGRLAWTRLAGLAPPSKHSPLSIMALGTHQ